MADYKVKSYSSYAKSMATPKSSGMSSKLDQKGYTPVSTTAKTTTAAAKTYQNTYASKDIYVPDAMSNKSKDKPVSGLGAKQTTAQSSVDVLDNKSDKTEKRFADAWINSGGSNYDGVYTGIPPSPVSVYETPSVQKMQDYLTGTSIMSALYEAQGLIDPATGGGLKIVEDRPMTAEEIKKFAPIKELTEKNITVEELGAMDAPMQKATLESLGITNAQWVSSQGPRPMSLQEFDQAIMDSVHYGRDPASIAPPPRPENIDPETGQPIQTTADVVANEVAQGLTPPALDGQPAVDALSNQLLEVPEVPEPSAGLMSRKPLTKEQSEALTNVNEIIKAQNSSIYKGKTFSQELLNKAVDQSIKVPTKRAMLKGIMTVEVAGRGPITEQGYSRKNIKDLGPNSAWRARLVRDGILTSDNKVTSEYSPENVFNSVYANRNGNGDYASGDGNLYKGRGLVQITGRSNYTAVQNKLREQGIDIDLISKPELVNEPEYALPAAIALVEHLGLTDETSRNMSARGLQKVINPKAPAATANERWDAAIEALREYDPAAADAMENKNEYKAQETVGTTVDGIIGDNSIRAMQNWLRTNNIAIPNNATGMDLVVLVNENS